MIEKKTGPYELLVRWDPASGLLVGAHYMTSSVVIENDEIIMQRINDPVPVSVNGSAEFPLATILDQALIDAFAMANEAAEQHLPVCAHRDALIHENEALIAEVQRLSP